MFFQGSCFQYFCIFSTGSFLGQALFALMSDLELKYFSVSVEDLSPFTCCNKTIALSTLLYVNKITLSPLSPEAVLSLFAMIVIALL